MNQRDTIQKNKMEENKEQEEGEETKTLGWEE